MNKKDLAMIKKTLKKGSTVTDRVSTVMIDEDKNASPVHTDAFLSLPEEVTDRYIDIMKKTLMGAKNLMTYDFTSDSEMKGQARNLEDIKNDGLKDEKKLSELIDNIKQGYDCPGKYVIIIAHGVYDVPNKASDGADLDESEDVYEHLLVSICPLTLTKPALSCINGKLADTERTWIVGNPTAGFLYPAFEDKQANIHSVLVFAKKSDENFTDTVLGVEKAAGADTQKDFIENLLTDDGVSELNINVAENIAKLIAEAKEYASNAEESDVSFSKPEVKKLLSDAGVSDEKLSDFDNRYDEVIGKKGSISADNISLASEAVLKGDDYTVKLPAKLLESLKFKDGKIMIPITGDLTLNGMPLSTAHN